MMNNSNNNAEMAYEKDLSVNGSELTKEFRNLLKFMETKLAKEIPTATLDLNYFMFAVLNQRNNLLCSLIESNMTSMAVNNIHDAYYQFLLTKALAAVKPNRKIVYDKLFNDTLIRAKEEAVKIGGNDNVEISTIHMFLAILSNDSKDNQIRTMFSKAAITHDVVLSKMNDVKWNDSDDENSERVLDGNQQGVNVINLGDVSQLTPEAITDKIRNAVNKSMDNPGNLIPGLNKKLKGKNANIKAYCSNLNEQAELGKITPLIGREREVNEIIRILGRKKKNNAILIGGEGVGKTAIAESLALKIVNEEVPLFLKNKVIVSLDMTALMAGTTLRGMFEERVKGILDEVKADPNFIIFMDNIGATLADKGKNDYEISSMLSRALENGECQVIGTSDFASYRKTFDKDPSLARRFQKIIVEAPTKEESIEIVHGLRETYESFHKVKFTDDAVDACVELAAKYITERNLPDSAIDIMDEVGSLIGTVVDDKDLKELSDEIKKLKREIEGLKLDEKFADADVVDAILQKKVRDYNSLVSEKEEERENNPRQITVDNILDVVSNKTGIPVNQLSEDDKKKLVDMNNRLKSEVIGQDEAIDTICKALKRNRVGLHKNGCMYSMMSIGKTGTGKTYVAKKLAKEIFGTEKALVRFDMSEYPDKTAVNKLIGSNPGYVGYEEGGQLTEAVKNKKYCVLLLDEIEKADKEVYNIFLQVLDEGFLTDNSGQKIDFSNVIIIFTSNVGAKAASDFGKGIGFENDENENTKRILNKELKNRFPPEFLNRLDNVIYFNSLSTENLLEIIRIEMNKLCKRVNDIGYDATFDDSVLSYILDKIKDSKDFGARPIVRAIQDNVEDKITDLILESEIKSGHTFNITVSDGNLVVK